MLILTRKLGESIKIGEMDNQLTKPITVTILSSQGNQVRVGVDAQREIRIDRTEVRERIDAEKRDAATAKVNDVHLPCS